MNTTVVIIGANGFLGRYLCRHFARNGREVVAIARHKRMERRRDVFGMGWEEPWPMGIRAGGR